MAVTRERFEQGLTYEQYKEQMARNRDRLEAAEGGFTPSESDLAAFRGLPKTLNVLAIAEDWCGDVIANLPILGKLAAESGKLNVRIFLRDQNLDLIDQYLKEGKYRSIPVFVFFDDSFQELGHFIERPASVTELRAQKRLELYAQNPDFGSPDSPVDQLPEEVRVRLAQATAQSREETTPWANSEVVRALRKIAERVPAGS
ncbi:MAG TPA: thioredoxin family protein [Chloroflexota bacterium]|nr:thioredoxin family protein [Chloroflexota bacterium]